MSAIIDNVCKLMDHAGGLVGAAIGAYALAKAKSNDRRLDRHGETIRGLVGGPAGDEQSGADPLDGGPPSSSAPSTTRTAGTSPRTTPPPASPRPPT